MTLGRHIWIEGTDGTGKSTQVELLQKRLLEEKAIQSIAFHEPGGVDIAQYIRDVIKNGNLERDTMTNLLLFSASRRENWLQKGKDALKDGVWVINARSWWSSLAFQGYGEGLDPHVIRQVTELATDKEYMSPDYALILDLHDADERTRRIAGRGALAQPDTFEKRAEEFQKRIREGYRTIASDFNVPIIDAGQSQEEISVHIWDSIFPNHIKT